MEAISLQKYICSLDFKSLPRVVKICSGVYFKGSIYEISGSECCLSTGDLMKIVAIQLQKVNCEDVETGYVSELPPHFKGLFQPSPELPLGNQRTMPGLQAFKRKLSNRPQEAQQYTLQEILQSSAMKWKTIKCPELGTCEFQLYPVYNVEAIMHLRNDVVNISSTLDVEVVDVTEETDHIHFIKPVMLSEVLGKDRVLPVEAEILGAPESRPIFHSDWFSHLYKGCRIHIHSEVSSWKIVATARKGRKHAARFLISSSYQGLFRQCPREFSSASELALGLGATKKLYVVVTKDYESGEGENPLFSVGDRLEVQSLTQARDPSATDMLVCCKDNGDADRELIQVPLFLEAGFMEDIRDSRRYTLSEAVEHLQLPCEVKVTAKDSSLILDPLTSFTGLTLEAQITEPFLLVSLVEKPSITFEIPPRWLDMSLFFTGRPVTPASPTKIAQVEELSETFYYSLLKVLPNEAPAPPRPPKRRESTMKQSSQQAEGRKWSTAETSKLPSAMLDRISYEPDDLLHAGLKQSGACRTDLSRPNQYTIQYGPPRLQMSSKQASDAHCSDNSNHDYEEVKDDLQETLYKMQRASITH